MEIKVRTLDETRAERVTIAVAPGQSAVIEIVDSAPSERLYTAEEVGDAQASEAELVAAPLRRRIAELVEEVNRRISEVTGYVIQRDEALDKVSALETERDDLKSQAAEFNRQRNQAVTDMETAQQAREIETKRAQGYDRDRKTERDRADQNRAWAERTEARLTDAIRSGDKARADLAAAQLRIDDLVARVHNQNKRLEDAQAAWQIQRDKSKRRALKLRAVGKLVHASHVDPCMATDPHSPMAVIVRGVRSALIGPPTPPSATA